jgi:hypothetical protein
MLQELSHHKEVITKKYDYIQHKNHSFHNQLSPTRECRATSYGAKLSREMTFPMLPEIVFGVS